MQACANDPQVAFHVIRNFARLARGTAVMRWSQLGFGRTSSTSTTQATPRNLMGFKDGTRNIKSESTDEMDRFVWVGAETDQPWMRGGSYLVARRIRMLIESWDTDYLADQEKVFGRVKNSGAPLTGTHEFDTPDLAAKGKDGAPVIDLNAHIRLAAPASNSGQMILRRGYSYTDGIDPTHRAARRRPVLHRLPEGSAQAVRADPATARSARPAQRVHPAHRQRAVRRAARAARRGGLLRQGCSFA